MSSPGSRSGVVIDVSYQYLINTKRLGLHGLRDGGLDYLALAVPQGARTVRLKAVESGLKLRRVRNDVFYEVRPLLHQRAALLDQV